MLWIQGGVCLIAWIALAWRFRDRFFQPATDFSRARVVGKATLWLLGSIVVLLAGMFLLSVSKGLQKDSMTLLGFVIVFLMGSGFIVMQLLAATTMISLIQSEKPQPASVTSNNQENL
jgi:hypothetical protein